MSAGELIIEAKKVAGSFTLSNEYFRAANVASALITDKQNIYTGVCIDIACGIGFCAEHAAIAEMLKNRETRIEMIVAVNEDGKILPPCGRCREMMWQIDNGNADTKVVIGENKIVTLDKLLPERFI